MLRFGLQHFLNFTIECMLVVGRRHFSTSKQFFNVLQKIFPVVKERIMIEFVLSLELSQDSLDSSQQLVRLLF